MGHSWFKLKLLLSSQMTKGTAQLGTKKLSGHRLDMEFEQTVCENWGNPREWQHLQDIKPEVMQTMCMGWKIVPGQGTCMTR